MIVYLARDIPAFVMYCVNGESGSSLLIECIDSMINYTVFPRIVRARSINFTVRVMRGQFEDALYSTARFNSTDHAAKPRHIVKLDRKILMQEVLYRLFTELAALLALITSV